jgi:uncharacterized membrane protein (Fun14 family)
VAIENIAAATNSFSPLLTSVGFSGLMRFLIGYAVKKIMKILAVGAGIFFAALMYLDIHLYNVMKYRKNRYYIHEQALVQI